MIYFLADTHFYHRLVKSYRKKNFELDVIKAIWETVESSDILFHLGDFTWNLDDETFLAPWKLIPAKKILVMGNHDAQINKNDRLKEYFDEIYEFHYSLEYNGYKFLLTHYPASDPYRKKHKDKEEKVREIFRNGGFDFLIHGHIHGAHAGRKCKCFEDYRIPCMNVNIEYIGYRPISIEEVLEAMKNKFYKP